MIKKFVSIGIVLVSLNVAATLLIFFVDVTAAYLDGVHIARWSKAIATLDIVILSLLLLITACSAVYVSVSILKRNFSS